MNGTSRRLQLKPIACSSCPLRQLDAFAAVSTAELSFIQDVKADEFAVSAKGLLVDEGVPLESFFTLRAGWAFRFRTVASGGRQILNFLLPGDFIGIKENLNGDIADGVELLTSGVVCRFPSAALAAMHLREPRLLSHLAALAACGEARLASNLATVGQMTARQRIASLFMDLYQRAVEVGLEDGSGEIEFPLTQRHIADALGLSLVHTHRTLQQFRARGWYAVRGGRLAILRPEAMLQLSVPRPGAVARRPLF